MLCDSHSNNASSDKGRNAQVDLALELVHGSQALTNLARKRKGRKSGHLDKGISESDAADEGS